MAFILGKQHYFCVKGITMKQHERIIAAINEEIPYDELTEDDVLLLAEVVMDAIMKKRAASSDCFAVRSENTVMQ